MKRLLHYACLNYLGNLRVNNEDNFFIQGNYRKPDEKNNVAISGKIVLDARTDVIAVFDGMGGEAYGEIASLVAASHLCCAGFDFKKPQETVVKLCNSLNHEVCEFAVINGTEGMGTTIAGILLDKKRWYAFNVGDSRAYIMSRGELSLLSVDHISPRINGRKGALLQYLGLPENEYHLKPSTREMKYHNNDLILICTDGLTDMVSDEDIAKILEKDESEEQLAWHLCERALQNGGRDNITLILLRVKKYWF